MSNVKIMDSYTDIDFAHALPRLIWDVEACNFVEPNLKIPWCSRKNVTGYLNLLFSMLLKSCPLSEDSYIVLSLIYSIELFIFSLVEIGAWCPSSLRWRRASPLITEASFLEALLTGTDFSFFPCCREPWQRVFSHSFPRFLFPTSISVEFAIKLEPTS